MADGPDNWWEQDAKAPTGAAYKATLPPERAAIAQGMVDGRIPIPTGAALRSTVVQQQVQDAAMIDPTFDVANAKARTTARTAFTSGKQGQGITSYNTAIGHLGTLAQAMENLHNSGFPIYNRVVNAFGPELGNTDLAARLKSYGVARTAATEELTRAFKQSGGNVHEVEQWEQQLDSADSPEAGRAAIGMGAKLLGSRIDSTHDSYNEAMGTVNQGLPMLNPHAQSALAAFQSPSYLSDGYKAVAPAVAGGGGEGGGAPPGGAAPAPLNPQPGPQGGGPAPLANDQLQISDGTSRAVDQTATKPIREQVARMVASGASGNDIRGFLTQSGVNPSGSSGIDELVAWRKANPTYKGGYDITVGPQNVDMGRVKGLAADIAGSAPATAITSGANTALLGMLPKAVAGIDAIGGRLGGDNRDIGTLYNAALGGANFKLNMMRDAHPVSALVGDSAGFLAGDAAIGAIPGVAKLAGKLPSVLRPAVGDAIFGAGTGVGSSDHLSDVPGNLVSGGVSAALGGMLGRGGAKAIGAVLSPVATGAVRRLTDAGVALTPGQILGAGGGMVGRTVKGIEDRAAGFPVIGDVINGARRHGTEDFNRAAINDALAPIGGALPKDVPVGHAAVAHAQQAVDDAYAASLSRMTVPIDTQAQSDLRAVGKRVTGMADDQRKAFVDIMDNDIAPYIPANGVLKGDHVQAIKQGLDKEIAKRRGPGASPQDHTLGDRLEDVRDAVMNLAGRADPANAAAFQDANRAFSMLSRVETAAGKGKDGVFTPNMFRQSVVKRGYGTTRANVASGTASMQQLATDASTVLPNAVSDSGTAGRAALGVLAARAAPGASGAALGAGVGYSRDGGTGALAGAALGSALFSRPGVRAAQWALAGSRGKAANTLGAMLRRNAALGGAVGTPLLLESTAHRGE